MTEQELKDLWQRYMHRRDLQGDLDMTYALAQDRVEERLMFKTVDMAEILATSPRMLIHAGLMQLAELAQDDIQAQRERAQFEDAVADYSYRRSIDETDAVMRPNHAP